MRRLCACVLLLLACIQVKSQNGAIKINATQLNQELIHTLFLQLLNHHRDSLHLATLSVNGVLNLAAQCQGNYMASNALLTHSQPDKTKATPSKRVELFNGSFATIGENCLFVPLAAPFKIKTKTFTIITYNDLAYAMFLSWKYSAPHYKNMINKDFTLSGFNISYSAKNNSVFAAQVFAGKEYVAPKKFPRKRIFNYTNN